MSFQLLDLSRVGSGIGEEASWHIYRLRTEVLLRALALAPRSIFLRRPRRSTGRTISYGPRPPDDVPVRTDTLSERIAPRGAGKNASKQGDQPERARSRARWRRPEISRAVYAKETVRFCDVPPRSRRASGAKPPERERLSLSDALIAASAFDPGQSSRSDRSLSGRSAVPRISCSSFASSSI